MDDYMSALIYHIEEKISVQKKAFSYTYHMDERPNFHWTILLYVEYPSGMYMWKTSTIIWSILHFKHTFKIKNYFNYK